MANYRFTLPIYGVVAPTKGSKNPSLTLNWYRNVFYRISNKAKKEFKKQVAPQINAFDPVNGKIKVKYVYYAARKGTDLDNFVSVTKKFFQDALVEEGFIKDDNCEYIVENNEKFGGYDKENPRVEAEVILID